MNEKEHTHNAHKTENKMYKQTKNQQDKQKSENKAFWDQKKIYETN